MPENPSRNGTSTIDGKMKGAHSGELVDEGTRTPRLSALEPKSRASTNSATSAQAAHPMRAIILSISGRRVRARREVLKINAAYDKKARQDGKMNRYW